MRRCGECGDRIDGGRFCEDCGRARPCPCDRDARRGTFLIYVCCLILLAALLLGVARG